MKQQESEIAELEDKLESAERKLAQLYQAVEELFRIVQRERLLPQAREEQIAGLLARWRE